MATVRYLVASIKFYTENLGFELQNNFGPPFAIIKKDDLTIWLAGPLSSAAKPMPDGRKPKPGGWNRFVFEVEDLESSVTSMKEKRRNIL